MNEHENRWETAQRPAEPAERQPESPPADELELPDEVPFHIPRD